MKQRWKDEAGGGVDRRPNRLALVNDVRLRKKETPILAGNFTRLVLLSGKKNIILPYKKSYPLNTFFADSW